MECKLVCLRRALNKSASAFQSVLIRSRACREARRQQQSTIDTVLAWATQAVEDPIQNGPMHHAIWTDLYAWATNSLVIPTKIAYTNCRWLRHTWRGGEWNSELHYWRH